MKIAFCLTGLIGGVVAEPDTPQQGGNEEILKLGYKHYKKHIFDANPECEIDVFCHSSNTEFGDEINKLYKPKKSLYIKEPKFNIPYYVVGDNNRKRAHYHKWFSHKMVNELRKEYENETNTKYDFVYIGRYDICWNTDVIFKNLNNSKFYLTNWNRLFFSENMVEIKGAHWYKFISQNKETLIKNNTPPPHIKSILVGYPHNTEGVMDSWCISNPEYINILCSLYDNLNEYTKPGTTWMGGQSTVCDHNGKISNHRLIPKHLEENNLLDKLDFIYYTHDDYPLARRYYFNTDK